MLIDASAGLQAICPSQEKRAGKKKNPLGFRQTPGKSCSIWLSLASVRAVARASAPTVKGLRLNSWSRACAWITGWILSPRYGHVREATKLPPPTTPAPSFSLSPLAPSLQLSPKISEKNILQ